MGEREMRLSIVVNMYNTAEFLPKCMNSLINQDIPGDSYEIILVDDGSTDNSLELANSYLDEKLNHPSWPEIRIYSHPNKGLAGARNTGVDAAIGEYLCFVDPDDYIEENSLASLLQQMDDEQLDMLRFNYQKINEDGQYVVDSEMEASFDYSSKIMTGIEFMADRLTTTCYVWAYIYRLELIKRNNIRFIEGGYFDDVPWLPRVLQMVERINCTSVRHQYYLQRNGSLVRTIHREAILRKVNGLLELICILIEQMNEADAKVRLWYKMMLTHICVSILSSVAIYDYTNCNTYLKKIQFLFPLSLHKSPSKIKRKIRTINLCPQLFLWLVHLKNKK